MTKNSTICTILIYKQLSVAKLKARSEASRQKLSSFLIWPIYRLNKYA